MDTERFGGRLDYRADNTVGSVINPGETSVRDVDFAISDVRSVKLGGVLVLGYKSSKQHSNYLDDVDIGQEIGVAPSEDHEDGEHECGYRDHDGDDGRKTHICGWGSRDDIADDVADDIADGCFPESQGKGVHD